MGGIWSDQARALNFLAKKKKKKKKKGKEIMREEVGRIKNEKWTTKKKKKNTEERCISEKWDTQRRSALPYLFCLGAMVRRISRCTKESCLQFFDDKVRRG